jgi:hypothetical protein
MKLLLIPLLGMNILAMAETDPCKLDYKNSDCNFKVRYSLSGQYDMDGKPGRAEYASYVNNYYKKYGIEGFLYQASNRSTLFEHAFDHCENDSFKLKLLKDFPKGKVIEGKNLFQLMLPEFAFANRGSLHNYIFSLNTLFPETDNENLKKTQELYGLPWDDPSFLNGYIDNIKKMIAEIDRKNNFFKYSENLEEKEKLQKIIDRLTPYAKVADEVCGYTKMEEIELAKSTYKDLFLSPQKNVIGCLLKKEQCELAGSLINSGDYPPEKLGEYFDTIIHLKSSKACVESLKTIYLSMLRNGNPLVSSPKYTSIGILKEFNVYFQKYPYDDQSLCESEVWVHRNNLDDFTENVQKVVARQGLDLMNKILVETDADKKEALVNQFVELSKLDVDLSKADPTTGKTMLHQMVDAGDYQLLDNLVAKGVEPYALGLGVVNKEGLNPVHYAISSGEANKIKFAHSLYSVMIKDAGDMLSVKSRLKKIKTKDTEVKEITEQFKNKVKVDLSHEY